PGLWTVFAQPPGYEEFSQSITIRPRATVRQQFTLTAATPAVLTATIQLDLRDVYGSPLQPPVTVDFSHVGAPVTPTGTTPSRLGTPASQLPWNSLTKGQPGATDVRVQGTYYLPADFRVTAKAGAVTVSRQMLLFDPQRVQPDVLEKALADPAVASLVN